MADGSICVLVGCRLEVNLRGGGLGGEVRAVVRGSCRGPLKPLKGLEALEGA